MTFSGASELLVAACAGATDAPTVTAKANTPVVVRWMIFFDIKTLSFVLNESVSDAAHRGLERTTAHLRKPWWRESQGSANFNQILGFQRQDKPSRKPPRAWSTTVGTMKILLLGFGSIGRHIRS